MPILQPTNTSESHKDTAKLHDEHVSPKHKFMDCIYMIVCCLTVVHCLNYHFNGSVNCRLSERLLEQLLLLLNSHSDQFENLQIDVKLSNM